MLSPSLDSFKCIHFPPRVCLAPCHAWTGSTFSGKSTPEEHTLTYPGVPALGNCGTGKHSWGRQIGGFTHAYYLECMCSFSWSSKAVDGDIISCGGHFSMPLMSTCHCPKRQINSVHMLPGPTRTKGMCCARTALLQTFKILAAVVLMQHDWRNEWRMPQHVSFCDLSSVTARADCLWTPRLCPTGPRVPSPFEDSDAFGGTLIVLLPSAKEGACTAQQLQSGSKFSNQTSQT